MKKRDTFEVYVEGDGWLVIYRGQNSFGSPLKTCAGLYGFEKNERPNLKKWPHQFIMGVDCGLMLYDGNWRLGPHNYNHPRC